MEPTSPWLIILPLLAAGGLIYLVSRHVHAIFRVLAGLVAVALAMATGIVAVNDYYGYYQTWASVRQDFSDAGPDGMVTAPSKLRADHVAKGEVERVSISGAGISRYAYVYLPPQYFERASATVQFPVVELFHGSPGKAADWFGRLNVNQDLDNLINDRQMGPTVVVMPNINGAHSYEDCVDSRLARDDTYLSTVVPAYVRSHFRVAKSGLEYGLGGYSSGGYCAANLALRHRGQFAAAAVMDGYFRAQDGPPAQELGHARGALAANSPLTIAQHLTAGSSQVPSFFIAAGTGMKSDYDTALQFADAMGRVEQVSLLVDHGASHNFYAWQEQLPSALTWLWRQISTPQLRSMYPTSGGVVSVHPVQIGSAPSA